MAARHQWVRGWCRHRALEHMQELLELQAEQGVGLVEVVTKLGIILKKGLRYILCVCACACAYVRACVRVCTCACMCVIQIAVLLV